MVKLAQNVSDGYFLKILVVRTNFGGGGGGSQYKPNGGA